MTAVMCWLMVVGVVDLARLQTGSLPWRWRLVLAGCAAVGTATLLWSAHPAGIVGWSALLVAIACAAGWEVTSSASPDMTPPTHRRTTLTLGAYGFVVVAIVALVIAGPRAGRLRWFDDVIAGSAVADYGSVRVLAVIAVVVAQISTANVLVRLLLDVVGVPAQDHEKALRGGRVLGPMERVLIVGLALAGNGAGVSVVVAAKALLRFPEVRRASAGGMVHGATDVTEYFLIGSFASWTVALGSAGLALIGR